MNLPAAELADRLAQCRADWLPRYFAAGRIEGGMFLLGDADGAPGRSLPVPLRAKGKIVDFAGDFRGDDLDLLARAIGGDSKAAYKEALAFLGLGGKVTPPPRRAPPPEPEPDCRPDLRDNSDHAQELWREAAPLCDCRLGAVYLRSRGIHRWPEPIYFHPACPFGRERAPAILAPVNDPHTGLVRAIWRIRLDSKGRKLWRGGYGRVPHGAASRLFDHWDGRLGIAEGIEDALALHLRTGWPCWAALSAGGMARMILPERVRRVVICQDNDAPNDKGRRPGPEAAQALRRRLRAEGRDVRIVASDTGKDANDALRGAAA